MADAFVLAVITTVFEMKRILVIMSLAATLFTGASCGQKKDAGEFSIGFQLYSVRRELQKDFEGTLKKVKDMGFEGVEFFSEYYGHSVPEVKKICDDLGLVIFSNHVPYQQMITDLDQVIKDNKTLGVEYIAFPYMDNSGRPAVDPEKFKEIVSKIGEVGKTVKKEGIQLLYHNHDFEFKTLPDGTVGHDYIFASTPASDVQVELDVCWSDFSGFKGDDLVRKYSGRVPVLHMKDYYLEGKLSSDPYALIGIESDNATQQGGKFEFRPLGDGVVDIPAIIEAAKENGVKWLCVEQDEPTANAADAFEGPARSIAYLRNMGLMK